MYQHQPPSALPPLSLRDAILKEARRQFPREICGAWSQTPSGHWQHHPWTNLQRGEAAQSRFVADPLQVLAVLEAQDRGELTLRGLYHSHPYGPPTLSSTDLQQMTVRGAPTYPDLDLLLLAMPCSSAPQWALFRWET